MEEYSHAKLANRPGYRTVPMKVLCFSMPRSGTTSLTAALEILGYANVYHGWTIFDDLPGCRKWTQGLRAKYFNRGKPLTKQDFDWLLGQSEATGGDFPSIAFVDELLAAYPEAKVVLVEREIGSWHKSLVRDVLPPSFKSINHVLKVLDPQFFGVLMNFWPTAYLGFFNAKSKDEVIAHLNDAYKAHYAHVRAVVPKEKLLNFELKDGWGPLCEFLEKPVPEESFPHLNEKGMVRKREAVYQQRSMMNMAVNFAVAGSVLGGFWWLYRSNSGRKTWDVWQPIAYLRSLV